MSERYQVWEWDSASIQRQLPRWLELAVAFAGLLIVLVGAYFISSSVFDHRSALVVVGLIALVSIGVAHRAHESELQRDRRLIIRVDDTNVSCRFLGKARVYALERLDWSKVEMTSGVSGVLMLAERDAGKVRRYPIFGMSKINRRELWRALTRHRESPEVSLNW